MAFLRVADVSKRFGHTTAVQRVNLEVGRGEFLTLLGPSGCGKTTILRMIAGFESPSAGSIFLDDEDITHLSASRRPMGMVFQSYALFPHMTAEQNIAFGMQVQRKPADFIKQRCGELLDLVGLRDKGKSYPHQLSGGQQQRIALARALAVEPKVLLLDEPLSALDAQVRVTLRDEIRRIQQHLHMTALYVTHDQEEALAISDRIAVMAKGRIEQLDQPEEIYRNPRTVFAATFVGASNQFNGVMTSARNGLCQVGEWALHVPAIDMIPNGTRVLILVRPEAVSVLPAEATIIQPAGETHNEIAGSIVLRTFLGAFTRFHVSIDDRVTLTADVPSQQAHDLTNGQPVTLTFPPQACQVLPLDATVQGHPETSAAQDQDQEKVG